MGALNPYQTAIWLLLTLLLTCAKNVAANCKPGCPQSDSGLLKYAPGKVYEYNFDSILTIGIGHGVSGENDDTSLKILGNAKLFAEGNCGYTLQLGAVKVSATKEAIEKKIAQSIQKPVSFTMVDGKLQPELCADPADNQYALNVKRAIISLLQSNPEDGVEVDVFGQCSTHTSSTTVGNSQVITKVRDLNTCSYREGNRNGFVHGVVNQAAGVKSSMLFKANYAKESKLTNGIIDNVHLVEEYSFGVAPKTTQNVRAKVVTSLKVKNPAGAPAPAPTTAAQGAPIFFQNTEAYAAKNIAALKAVLTDLVNKLDGYVKKDSAKGFVELIRLMRNADGDVLIELASVPHPNKVLARKVYLDALFRTGTAESAKAIMKQLNKMEDKEKIIAIVSLNLVQTVDKETVSQAAVLLTPNAPKQLFLAVGKLVSKYCQSKSDSCHQNAELEAISKKFVDNLKHCKANTKKDEDRIIYVLKGIANMDFLANSAASVLTECATAGHSTRIRVAALQAFSAASCEPDLAKKAIDVLLDRNEDSELRIEAYLAAVQCPTAEMANQIAELMNSETVYQVGGFIASHLKAIRDSTDATRSHQRYYLGNIRVTKHFPRDYRRYSFNNELSYNLEALGFSASADYKLIYSQHGFLPRSARLNITTELFGTNFNFFEATLRQENIENFLEYYIGPKGLLNKDFDEIMKVIEVGGAAEAGGRARRSIADDTSKFSKKYKTYGNKNMQDVNLDLSLKFFGSELMFLSLGDYIPNSLDDVIKHFSTTVDNVKKELSAFNKEINLHDLFLDVSLAYPTGVGIPLELQTQGFAANKLEFGINLDVDAILEQNWQRAKYRLKLVPSVDIDVNVQVGFNAYVLATGMRVESSLHSTAGADVNFAFTNEGNGFNMDIDLPRDKLDFIDVQITPGFYVAELDKTVKVIPLKEAKRHKDEKVHMCFNQLDNIGLNFCIDSVGVGSVKNDDSASVQSLHSLVRPVSFSAYVEAERKYNLKGSYVPQTNTGAQQWKLELSTPSAKDPHSTSVSFELSSNPRTYGRFAFDNAQYRFALEAGINNDNKELVVYAQYESNDDVKRNRIGFVRNGNEYRPVIEIQDKNGVVNDINGYRMDGRVVVQKTGDKQARYTFENFQITNKDNERVVVNGWADVGTLSLNSELHTTVGQSTYLVKSKFKLDNGVYDLGVFANDERSPENVIGGSVHLQIDQQNYALQVVGAAGTWEVDIGNELNYVMPEDATTITSSKFKQELTVKHKNNVIGQFKLSGLTENHKKLQLDAEIVRSQKIASLSVKFDGNQRAQGDFVLEVNAKYNKYSVDLLAKCDVNGNHFVVDNTLSTSAGTVLTMKGELGQRYSAQDIYIDVHGSAQLTGKDKQSQWLLKVIGAPEKTTSDFKLARDNVDLLTYHGELQHPQDKVSAGKVNLVVKSIFVGKADFKVAKNGKGELTASVETLKTDQKHKIEVNSKFHVQAPKYDVETTITVDTAKKIYFKTENVLDKAKFSTKNVLEADNKQVTFDANGSIKGEWSTNGELQGNFVLSCPSGHVVEGNVNRKMTTNSKTGNAQGNLALHLSDSFDGKKRSLDATVKVDKVNLKTKEIAQELHLVYTGSEGKQIELNSHIKHLPKGQNKMIDFGYILQGDNLPLPTEVKFVVDEYNSKHAVYHVDLQGTKIKVNVNGKYNLGDTNVPSTYDIQGNVNVPESSFKSIQFNSNGKLLSPSTEEGGTYIIELHLDERAGNGQFILLNTEWKGSQQQGAYNFEVQTKEMEGPLKIQGSYQRERQGNVKEGTISGKQKYVFNSNYANKYVKSTTDLSYVGTDTATILFTLDSSFDSAKGIEAEVRVQKLEIDTYEVKSQFKSGSNVYKADMIFHQATHKKGLELRATVPSGQPVVVIGVFEALGERKAKLRVQVENLGDLDLALTAEGSYKGVDDFYVQAQWNSTKLNLPNYDLDVHTEGKMVVFNLKNAQGVVFAGSATYSLKKEKSKTIIEGQGLVQYHGKPQKTNFRLIHQVYDMASDNEIGFSYTFNGNFGPKNGVSTLKITNKDFNVKLSICEEKKQCTNVQVQSIVTSDKQDIDSTQHSLLVLIDLRELGYPYEFEFQSKTIRQGFKLQYSLDSKIISNNNLKYQLVANVLPNNSKIQLKLPTREILLETKQQFPEQGQFFGHYENSLAFYFDKTNKPQDITSLVFKADITGQEFAAINSKSELQFSHPTIRPLSISSKFDANRQQQVVNSEVIFDIFRTPEQKIIASVRTQNTQGGNGFNIKTTEVVQSEGLGFRYEFNGQAALNVDAQEISANAAVHSGASNLDAKANLLINKDRLELTVTALNEPILKVNGDFNRQKYAAKFDTKIQLFSQSPVELITEVQPTSSKLTVVRQGLLNLNADLKLGKEVKVNIEGTNKQLFNGRVALDAANFLQTTYNSNGDDIKAFLNTIEEEFKKDSDITTEKIKNRFKQLRETVDKQTQLLKESVPDFSQLKANYEANVNEIVKELENDPALKQISETYHKLYTKLVKIAGDIAKSTSESYEELYKSWIGLYEKLEVLLKESVLPAWEEFMVTATKLLGQLRVELVNLITNAVQTIWSVLEQYGPALKNYGKAINDALKPFNEAGQELVKALTHAIEELLDELKEYVAKLPTFDAIQDEFKDRVKKLKIVERTLEFVNNLFDQLHILPQTPETSEFLNKLRDYSESKLKNQSVDDVKLLQEIFKLLVKAVRSMWSSLDLGTPIGTADVSGNLFVDLFGTTPESLDIFGTLPAWLSLRTSVFNFLLNENWEQIFSKDHFQSWVFFHDFDLHGHIADGHQFFTFDGQQYGFLGTCKYIIAQDSVDNNFTVVGQLNNGKLKSITLADRDGNYVEISDAGVLKLDGNAVEFPQHANGIHAWRLYYTVWVLSEYGVEVMCTTDLKICHVKVNGFYTSKTRGLLGNGNAEPNDDFLQVDGTIASNYATFASGYGLGKCNPVQFTPLTDKHADICNELFGLESSLAIGYIFENVLPYRTACDNAVAAAAEKEKESAACTIATAYASTLKLQKNPIRVPSRCLKCAGTAGQRELGQEFTVKLPSNKADVVFVIDLEVSPTVLSNLVAPAINEVRETLKTRGFTDIQIGVIAYNESQLYPAILTSDNGKLNYNGNVATVQLNGPKHFCLQCLSQVVADQKVIDVYNVLERLLRSIEPQSDEKAFHLAMNYPFRAGAAKSIVGVRSNSLEFSSLFKLVRAHIANAATNFNGALLHLIGPVKDMSLEGVPAEKLIGFNSRLVATIDAKDAKKRQKLQFENDVGIDFVLDNGGWVFATQNFDQLKPGDQKKTLNQVANSIADTLFKTEIISECECEAAHGLHAQHKCITKSSIFVANKKAKAAA